MPDPAREVMTQAFEVALETELMRRLEVFETYDDTTFGRIDWREALAFALFFVGVPLVTVLFLA